MDTQPMDAQPQANCPGAHTGEVGSGSRFLEFGR